MVKFMNDVTEFSPAISRDMLLPYMYRVHRTMFEIAKLAGFDWRMMQGYWRSGPNTFYGNLMPSLEEGAPFGLGMSEYYGMPAKMMTPLGGITFHGSTSVDDSWRQPVHERFGLVPLWGYYDADRPQGIDNFNAVNERDGSFGPIWGIERDYDGEPFGPANVQIRHVGIPDISCWPILDRAAAKANWELIKDALYTLLEPYARW